MALQSDGWILRSEILWHKPNAVPEKVADRPTRDHETLFLLSKQKSYYYDAAAIAEPLVPSTLKRIASSQRVKTQAFSGISTRRVIHTPAGRIMPSGWTPRRLDVASNGSYLRNKRTVWKVSTQGYRGAHFATFPPGLVRPCILAGCPVGGTVLDPFMGSGTTGLVAVQEGRKAIGIELNSDYLCLATDRVA